jgi:hypothetical protein
MESIYDGRAIMSLSKDYFYLNKTEVTIRKK